MRLSLRGRVLLGAILWTLGMFTLASYAVNYAIVRHPSVPEAFHAAFHHTLPVLTFGAVCMIAGLLQVRRGLSPINRLRERLADVHAGRLPRVEGRYPAEVQPLVDDLNTLLDDRERRVARAAARAGDLAHGLKTPLAVLAQEGERAAAGGHAELAAALGQQVDRMRRQIDRHLALARSAAAGAGPAVRTPVTDSTTPLVRTMQQLYAGRALRIDAHVAAEHACRAPREDLDELLGNLLDNACKWARARVVLSSAVEGRDLLLTIDDDGPGIDASKRAAVMQRGARADESAPGSGLGLAIVADLAAQYGGTIVLEASPIGGLRAALRLPAAND